MINKNFYRKTNDKKILHKVGKQWKVVSVALLMAIGGGAAVAATNNASANADATNYNTGVTAATSDEAQSLEAMDNYANPYAKAPKSVAPSASAAKAPSFENIDYAPSARVAGNNASAASYKNNENFDKANIAYYGPIVKSYVNSINARYPQARSLATDYNTASGKAANDQSLSGSYEATAKNSETANVIASKAAHDGVTASYYTDSVAYAVLGANNDAQTNGYVHDVSNDASLASVYSAVASGASLVSAINKSTSLSTEYADKYSLASATAHADSQYASAQSQVASDVDANSEANVRNLNSDKTSLNSLSLQANVAGINSSADASFVNAVATSAGFSYSSSVVSSAVSLIAAQNNTLSSTSVEGKNTSAYALQNIDTTMFSDAQVSVNGNDLVFSANNQTTKPYKQSAIAMGNDTYDLSNAINSNLGNVADEQAQFNLIQVISDTAAQQSYASLAPGLKSNIAKDQAAISSYDVATSIANSNAASAETAYTDASSVAASASYLGNHPELSKLFGTTTVTQYGGPVVSGTPQVSMAAETANYNPSDPYNAELTLTPNNAIKVTAHLDNNGNVVVTNLQPNNNGVQNGGKFGSADKNGEFTANVKATDNYYDINLGDAGLQFTPTFAVTGLPTLVKEPNTTAVNENNVSVTPVKYNSDSSNNAMTVKVQLNNDGSVKSISLTSASHQTGNIPFHYVEDSQDYEATEIVPSDTTNGQDFAASIDPTKNVTKTLDGVTASVLQSNTKGLSNHEPVTPSTKADAVEVVAKVNGTNPEVTSVVAVNSADAHLSSNFTSVGNGSYAAVETAPSAKAGSAVFFDNNTSSVKGVSISNVAKTTSVGGGLFNGSEYSDAANNLKADYNGIGWQANNVSSAASAIATAANSEGSLYKNTSSASASYSNSAMQDVTIASQFADFYGSKFNVDSTSAASAKSNLDNFYDTHAANQSEFDNADTIYNSASAIEPNDADLAHAFGINVLNHSPKYIVLDHNAMLHSDPNYSKANATKSVKAGATFTVEGVGFDKVGNIRYEVNANGKPAFVTANDYYVENAYLEPGETYDVTLSHDAMEHTDLDYAKGKAAKKAVAGTTLKGVTAVRGDNFYEGITRLQLADGNYITANKYYLTNVQEVANNSNNTSNVQYGKVTF